VAGSLHLEKRCHRHISWDKWVWIYSCLGIMMDKAPGVLGILVDWSDAWWGGCMGEGYWKVADERLVATCLIVLKCVVLTL
jgi:hypothetical protein